MFSLANNSGTNCEGQMRKIGYARVSSAARNLDRQLGALRAERCDQIFAEKMSAKSLKGRPQLEKAIDALGTGDVLVVAEWDRVTRSMMDGIAIIDRVLARGALVKVLDKPHLDLTCTIGKGLLAFLSAIAQDERERIAKRASEGRAAAKAAGRRFGRKPKLDDHQQAEARRRLAAGESFRAIARSYRCSHTTVSRLAGA
jgi:DNA invertase Pin-like site-specific DNA recombinase